MVSTDLNLGIIFLTQAGLGSLGSASLRLSIFTSLTRRMLRPTDLILVRAVTADTVVRVFFRIPQTMAAFGLESFLDEAGHGLVFSSHRVARRVSLSTTCLHSSFQASKLNANTSMWQLRVQSPKCTGFCCFLCWMLHLLLYIFTALHVTEPRKRKNMSLEKTYEYYNSPISIKSVVLLHAVMFSFVMSLVWASWPGLLAPSSLSCSGTSSESNTFTATTLSLDLPTRTVLILVSMFISFYFLSSILSSCVALTVNPTHWLTNTCALASSGFPAFSPFVLLACDARASRFSAFWGKSEKKFMMFSRV
uniref:Vomeronasal type-1 receptor n=1 Tax=Mustela putorius furo TaxID=9669 RepID=M3Y4E3_MUSPF